jgi:hypothetical protein
MVVRELKGSIDKAQSRISIQTNCLFIASTVLAIAFFMLQNTPLVEASPTAFGNPAKPFCKLFFNRTDFPVEYPEHQSKCESGGRQAAELIEAKLQKHFFQMGLFKGMIKGFAESNQPIVADEGLNLPFKNSAALFEKTKEVLTQLASSNAYAEAEKETKGLFKAFYQLNREKEGAQAGRNMDDFLVETLGGSSMAALQDRMIAKKPVVSTTAFFATVQSEINRQAVLGFIQEYLAKEKPFIKKARESQSRIPFDSKRIFESFQIALLSGVYEKQINSDKVVASFIEKMLETYPTKEQRLFAFHHGVRAGIQQGAQTVGPRAFSKGEDLGRELGEELADFIWMLSSSSVIDDGEEEAPRFNLGAERFEWNQRIKEHYLLEYTDAASYHSTKQVNRFRSKPYFLITVLEASEGGPAEFRDGRLQPGDFINLKIEVTNIGGAYGVFYPWLSHEKALGVQGPYSRFQGAIGPFESKRFMVKRVARVGAALKSDKKQSFDLWVTDHFGSLFTVQVENVATEQPIFIKSIHLSEASLKTGELSIEFEFKNRSSVYSRNALLEAQISSRSNGDQEIVSSDLQIGSIAPNETKKKQMSFQLPQPLELAKGTLQMNYILRSGIDGTSLSRGSFKDVKKRNTLMAVVELFDSLARYDHSFLEGQNTTPQKRMNEVMDLLVEMAREEPRRVLEELVWAKETAGGGLHKDFYYHQLGRRLCWGVSFFPGYLMRDRRFVENLESLHFYGDRNRVPTRGFLDCAHWQL